MAVNPHNFQPVFMDKQLSASLQVTTLYSVSLCSATIIDTERLHMDICTAYAMDPVAASHLLTSSTINWSLSEDRLLLLKPTPGSGLPNWTKGIRQSSVLLNHPILEEAL